MFLLSLREERAEVSLSVFLVGDPPQQLSQPSLGLNQFMLQFHAEVFTPIKPVIAL